MSDLRFDDVPGWRFEINETSANVYSVVGRADPGGTVRLSGTDVELLLEQLKREARDAYRPQSD